MGDKSSNLASLSSTIKKGIENRLKDLHTAMPGIIQSFNSVDQTVSVQPAIKRIFKSTLQDIEILTPVDLPILINVPIVYPRGGGFSLTFPIAEGDECLLMFSERSIDNWHLKGGTKKPGARRFHSLSDAIAIVGLSSVPNKVPNYDNANVVLKKDDDSSYIKLKENSDIEIFSENNIDITAEGNCDLTVTGNLDAQVTGNVNITSPSMTLDGNVTVTGNLEVQGSSTLGDTVTSNGKDISDTHKHSSGTAGDGNTGLPL